MTSRYGNDMVKWLTDRVGSRAQFLELPFVSPIAHRLAHPTLWYVNRRSSARGIAVGLFVGFLIPLGQMPIAALLSLKIRANVLAAASATFVSNPVTFPLIYYSAYQTGSAMLSPFSQAAVEAQGSLAASALSTVASTALGLALFAFIAAALGFFGVQAAWRARVRRQWRARARNMPKPSPASSEPSMAALPRAAPA